MQFSRVSKHTLMQGFKREKTTLLYYAFGSAMPDMQYTSDTSKSYRFGFNGEEKMDDIDGGGMAYDLGARFYDGRLGRMFTKDPLGSDYPWQSTYSYCYNSPIKSVDIKGKGGWPQFSGPYKFNTLYRTFSIGAIFIIDNNPDSLFLHHNLRFQVFPSYISETHLDF